MKNVYKPFNGLKNKLIFSVNCGSSSIKISLFEYDEGIFHRLLDANFKGINSEKNILEIASSNGNEIISPSSSLDVTEGIKYIIDALIEKFNFSFDSLMGIGHRFVHGGNIYSASILIGKSVIAQLEKLVELAPLHNLACLSGIKECLKLCGSIPQIAIFDTAFHHTIPSRAASYAIPSEMRDKYQIKRYGFHGISNAFLWNTYKEHKGEESINSKVITLHLGNGCSITAISGGISIDTSMGFTPAEGLMMATRAGDVDAAIVEFMCVHDKKTPSEVMDMLNFNSGLLGVSGVSSHLENLTVLYHKDGKAKLAVDMFCYRIVKYIGAYIAVLGGVEAIIFSGGIGENSPVIREMIVSSLEWFHVKLNQKANEQAVKLPPGDIHQISAIDSSATVYVIATDENLFIAQEVECLVSKNFR